MDFVGALVVRQLPCAARKPVLPPAEWPYPVSVGEGDNADVIEHGFTEAHPYGGPEAVIQVRAESADGCSAQFTGKVDPQAPGWTKSHHNQLPYFCVSRMHVQSAMLQWHVKTSRMIWSPLRTSSCLHSHPRAHVALPGDCWSALLNRSPNAGRAECIWPNETESWYLRSHAQ
ncbi:hypothetical protein ACQJBY_001512 [Aegilops geniculata]